MDLNTAAVIFMGGYVVLIAAAGLVLSLRPGGATVPLNLAGPAGGSGGCGQAILLGGEVEAIGNFRGRVESALISPRTGRLNGITLASGGGLIEGDSVPAAAIDSADGTRVLVREPWSHVEPNGDAPSVALQGGAAVLGSGGKRLGSLRLVCFDPDTRLVSGLVASKGGRSEEQVFLPISRVKAAGTEQVRTDIEPQQWSSLQPYATDDAIRAAILERFDQDPAVRPLAGSVTVEVRGQRVELRGYVRRQAEAEMIAEVARSVPGVLAVERRLRSDEDLATAVREAINRDLGTSGTGLDVTSVFGQVDIVGQVRDRQALRRIDAAASRVQGVLVMHNLVTVV